MKRLKSLVLVAALAGCSSDANLLGKLTPDDHRDSYANLVVAGRAAYDRGDLKRALKLAKRARELDPDGEDAAILYGFVNLSLAHGDPYGLAQGLLRYEKERKLAAADPTSVPISPLTALKTVIGLTDAELLTMGRVDSVDAALPVIVPSCVETVRKSAERLSYLNEALTAICPYVPVEARVLNDVRQRCGPVDGRSEDQFRVLFLWAFAHLSEALAFNGVLTYGTGDPTGKKTNLELRVDKVRALDTTDPANLLAVLSTFDGVRSTLEAVMPISGVCSEAAPTTQLEATLNDMLAVDLAFALMPGIPAKITTSIRQAVERIRQLQASGTSGLPGGDERAKALKADLNKKISSALASKLDEIQASDASRLTPDQKTQACAAYASISAGVGEPPALCGPPGGG